MRWSRRAVAGWAVGTCLVSWVFSACLSPTLPLPPPGYPELAQLSADGKTVRIEGDGALHGATILVYNAEANQPEPMSAGVADGNGHYVVPYIPVDLSKDHTNPIHIWQKFGSDESDLIYVYIPFYVGFGAPSDDDSGAPKASDAGPADAGTSDGAE